MSNDEIVDEVRQAREQYVATHHDDIDEIYNDLKAKEQASGRNTVCFPPKHPTRNTVTHNEDVDAA